MSEKDIEYTKNAPYKGRDINNMYIVGWEFLMCKIASYINDINWAHYPTDTLVCWNKFVDSCEENALLEVLAEEAAELVAASFDNKSVVPIDYFAKNVALHMIRWGGYIKYFEEHNLEPME